MSLLQTVEEKCATMLSLRPLNTPGLLSHCGPKAFIDDHLAAQRKNAENLPNSYYPMLNYVAYNAYVNQYTDYLLNLLTEDEHQKLLTDIDRDISALISYQNYTAERRERSLTVCHDRLKKWWGFKRALDSGATPDMSRFYGLERNHHATNHPYMDEALLELCQGREADTNKVMSSARHSVGNRILNTLFKSEKRHDTDWVKAKADAYSESISLTHGLDTILSILKDSPDAFISDGEYVTFSFDTEVFTSGPHSYDMEGLNNLIQCGTDDVDSDLQCTDNIHIRPSIHYAQSSYTTIPYMRMTIEIPISYEIINSQPNKFWDSLSAILDRCSPHYYNLSTLPTTGYVNIYVLLQELGYYNIFVNDDEAE